VVEVQVSGLTPTKWAKLSARLTARKGIEFVSTASGKFYVRSRAAAQRITQSIRNRGYAVATAEGRIETAASRAFVAG
jgi:hypothetical protein